MQTLRGLREVFGDDLVVSPDLMAWAKDARSRELALQRIGRRDDTRLTLLPEVAPSLSEAMASRTYQRVGARWGAIAGSFLLADEPGLGKSVQALGALIEADDWKGDNLIAGPKASLKSVWERQIKMWTPDAQVMVMPEGKPKRLKALEAFWELEEPRFLIVNPAMLRRDYQHWCKVCEIWEEDVKKKKATWPAAHHLEDHKAKNRIVRKIRSEDWPEILNNTWNSIIIDESHDLLAAYTSANITQTTNGLLDMAKTAKHKIALTGTPLRGHETKLWGTLDFVGVKTGGYWGFVSTYFEVSDSGFGKTVHGLDPYKSREFYKLIDANVLRRVRSEVRKDLPLGKRYGELLPLEGKHYEQYMEFERMGETALESGLVAGLGVLSELTRLKQMAFGTWTKRNGKMVPTGDSPKLDFLEMWLRARGVGGKDQWYPEEGEGYKYLIASHLSEIVDATEEFLGSLNIPTLKITGGVTGTRRNDVQEIFQSNDKEFRVMLISTTAGGASIELDSWCDETIFLDETFVADDQVQVEGRTNNRSGAVRPRSWTYLRTAGTIDQKIAESNYNQHDMQHKLLDGRRGIQTALHLIREGVR